ncbi:MAG: glutaredoxin family protein [Chloroflexi bacterium]|nr:glutaredoxin family protein [Chloroflexota bacterium]
MSTPLPDLVLYARAGCGLCDEAREAIELLLARREADGLPVPVFVEHDIDADPELQRRWFDRIPVVELGAARLELATSLARLRRLLADELDRSPRPAARPAGAPDEVGT